MPALSRERRRLRRRRLFRHDADVIVRYLQKPAFDMKSVRSRRTQPKLAITKHGHHGGVAGENADLSIERRRNDRLGLTFEQDALG
jgi:hypothetical protein